MGTYGIFFQRIKVEIPKLVIIRAFIGGAIVVAVGKCCCILLSGIALAQQPSNWTQRTPAHTSPEKLNMELIVSQEVDCSEQIQKFVSNLDTMLSSNPKDLLLLQQFTSEIKLPNCGEETVREIFKKSKFFQSERICSGCAVKHHSFRLGTKNILVSIGYEPDSGHFPVRDSYVKWKKVEDDYE